MWLDAVGWQASCLTFYGVCPVSGDVVALALANGGEYLAAAKVRTASVEVTQGSQGAGSSSSAVSPPAMQYTLVPTKKCGIEDEVVFLEVVREGPWVGLKSWVANGALLQAKRKGTYRLAFFSKRFGVYEQWEFDEGENEKLEGIHWASTVVTLRNRKVPSVVLRVEIHRVGVCRYTAGEADIVEAGTSDEDPKSSTRPMNAMNAMNAIEGKSETIGMDRTVAPMVPRGGATQSIQTMSTMMVQEWIKFVEKEKARRARLQAKVDKATEDVEGLRKWAAQQIQCARQDVQEEIELLLETLNDRNAALADVQHRLDTRIQWGAALLEAKKAMILGRRVLLAWKAKTARAKYCEAVVNKLKKRNQVRAALRAIDSWRDQVERRKDLEKRLRIGVRRMSYLKMQSTFSAWRRTSHESHERARFEAARSHDASLIADSQRAKSVFASWRKRAARSKEAHRLLGFAANRYEEKVAALVFAAWKGRVQHVQVMSRELERRVKMREKTRLSSKVLDAWRLAVDDGHGEKIERDRSVAFDVKKTLKKSFTAWRKRVEDVKGIEVEAELVRMDRIRAVAGAALVLWRQHTSTEVRTREALYSFVHERALRRMEAAIGFWKEHTSFKRRTEAYVHQAEQRRAAVTLHRYISAWRAHTLEEKMHRRYVKICTERRALRQSKTIFSAWRATNRRSNKTFSGLLEYTEVWSQQRMRKAFHALREYTAEKARERALETKAINWYAAGLSSRVLGALGAEVARHADFLDRLKNVGRQQDLGLKRLVWNAWQFEVDETVGREANLCNFQRRKAWHAVNQTFLAWRKITAEEKYLNNTANARKAHVDSMRLNWAFAAWRGAAQAEVSERLQNRKADNWRRFKLLFHAFKAWKAQKDSVQATQRICDNLYARHQLQTKHEVLSVWRNTAEYNAHLRYVLLTITNARALEMQQAVFKAWRDKCASSHAKALLILRAVNKLSELRSRQVFEHWRLIADDAKGKSMYLGRMESLIERKGARSTLKAAFDAWRSRCLDIKAGLQQLEERKLAKQSVLRSTVFSFWMHQTVRGVAVREKALATIVQRQSSRLMIQAFVSWRHETTTQSRNGIVMLHAIDRLSFRMMKEAMSAWRTAAAERKRRRNMMVCLMEQSFQRRMKEAFSAWRNQAAEDIRVRQNLERCIMQKRVAYELYRESYWETVDEELQETLRAMFREADTDEEDIELSEYEEDSIEESTGASSEFKTDLGELDEIAAAFERKRRELSSKVAAAVAQGAGSPHHAMTPPRRELNLLEPLSNFFSSRINEETVVSGADSLSISSLDTDEADALLDVDIDEFEWSSCDEADIGDWEKTLDAEGCDDVIAEPFPGLLGRKLSAVPAEAPVPGNMNKRGMLFDLGVMEEPESPRILARGL